MSFAPLPFQNFIDTTADEQRWQIYNVTAGLQLPAYTEADLNNYVAADKPGTIVLKNNGEVVATLTLTYNGSNNLTSIVRS